MSYQVLARKWRPRSFETMVGQTHVLRALMNALEHGRLHHAYLFTGTRGVGKTTVARIFAKSLNCETGVTARPCGVCAACREIDAGRFVDLIEVDAASRTKVEDTRELLENVQYTPARGRYKVYLIDEVHMLSGHSFNALLKTLEEPPPHVKFLLATTDPQKLPATVLSRCLQFNLKRLPPDLIAGHLAHILKEEGVAAESAALMALARAADGSLRDALSLLDQAIAYGGGQVRESEARAMLGTLDRAHVVTLLDALAAGDGAAVLREVERLSGFAPDFEAVLAELLSLLQRVALAQAVPQALSGDETEYAAIMRLAREMAPEDVQLYYQIGLNGRRDLPFAPEARGGLEMILLRMLAFRPAPAGAEGEAPREISAAPAPPARTGAEVSAPPLATRPVQPPLAEEKPRPAAAENSVSRSPSSGAERDDWPVLVKRLALEGMLRQLAANCALRRREGDTFHLALSPQHASLRNRRLEERLAQVLGEHLGANVRLVFTLEQPDAETPAARQERLDQDRLRAARQSIEQDANIKALRDTFGARVVPDSIQPID